jgi:hypothetical protein
MSDAYMIVRNQNHHRPRAFFLKLTSLLVLAFLWFGLLCLAGCAPPAEVTVPQADFKTYTPPPLISTAESVLRGPVVNVGIHTFDWSSKKIFVVYTRRGKVGTFMENNGDYIQMNSRSGVSAINEVLRDYRFTRQGFADAESVYHFLETVVLLYEGEGRPIGSSVFLGTLGGPEGVARWSRHSKKIETALREVCRDPQFIFEGDAWVVTFNVLRPDGGVDQWKVEGEFSPATQSNAIRKMDKRALKKHGTFAYMMIG